MSQFPPHISNVVPIHSFSFLQPIHASLSSYARLFEKRVTNKHTTPLQLWSHSKPSFPSRPPQPSSDDSRRSNRATSLTCKRPCAHIWNGTPSLCIAAQKGSFGVEMKAVHCPWEYWVSDCKRLSYNKSRIHSSTNYVASQPSPIHAELPTPTPGFKLHSQQKSKTQENWNNAHAIKWSVSKIMNKTCNSLPIQCTSKSRHSPFHFSLLQFIASSPNTHSPFISPFNPRKFHTLFHLTKAWTWKPRRMVVSLVIKAFTEHMEKNGQKTIAMKSVFCCLLICYCTRVP